MSASAVQFRGVDSVVEAYELNKVAPWALLNGKQILSSYSGDSMTEGAGELVGFLELLKKGQSEARYTLNVYKLRGDAEILSNTPFFRSFNFTLFDSETSSAYYQQRGGMVNKMTEDMRLMNEKIDYLAERLLSGEKDEGEEKMSGIGAMLHGLLNIPEFQQAIAAKAIGLIDKIIPMNKSNSGPAKVAGVEGAGSLLAPDQVQKVQQAINILCTKDDKLGDHLMGVAKLATENPIKYKMAIAML